MEGSKSRSNTHNGSNSARGRESADGARALAEGGPEHDSPATVASGGGEGKQLQPGAIAGRGEIWGLEVLGLRSLGGADREENCQKGLETGARVLAGSRERAKGGAEAPSGQWELEENFAQPEGLRPAATELPLPLHDI